MSDLVRDTTRGIIGSVQVAEGFATDTWTALTAAGLQLIGVPDNRGGAGGSWQDAYAAVAAAAASAAAVPLAEALFGVAPGIALLDLDVPGGLGAATSFGAANALSARSTAEGWRIDGTVTRVPFARHADFVVLTASLDTGEDNALIAVSPMTAPNLRTTTGTNLADEPRDDIELDAVQIGAADAAVVGLTQVAHLRRLAALARAIQIAAALEAVVAITSRYANEREQFGRPISRFQAIGHHIGVMTGEAAVVSAATDAALASLGRSAEPVAVAAAKSRAGEAATLVARSAHQVLGALGFTQEHPLHRSTRRLWSWRAEAGTAEEWNEHLGALAFAEGATALWALLTDTMRGEAVNA